MKPRNCRSGSNELPLSLVVETLGTLTSMVLTTLGELCFSNSLASILLTAAGTSADRTSVPVTGVVGTVSAAAGDGAGIGAGAGAGGRAWGAGFFAVE